MSKDTPDKTDLSSMSKEELIAYLLKKNESLESQLKQQKEEAQKKEQASVESCVDDPNKARNNFGSTFLKSNPNLTPQKLKILS